MSGVEDLLNGNYARRMSNISGEIDGYNTTYGVSYADQPQAQLLA